MTATSARTTHAIRLRVLVCVPIEPSLAATETLARRVKYAAEAIASGERPSIVTTTFPARSTNAVGGPDLMAPALTRPSTVYAATITRVPIGCATLMEGDAGI